MLRRVVPQKLSDVSEVRSDSIIASVTSVNFCGMSRRNIPEDNHLHDHRRENLKSDLVNLYGGQATL
jgi:hypothetical protein